MALPVGVEHQDQAATVSAEVCRLVQRQYPRAYTSTGIFHDPGSGMIRFMQPYLLITWWRAHGPDEFVVNVMVSENDADDRMIRIKMGQLAKTVMPLIEQAMKKRARELEKLALEIAACYAV